MKWLIGLTLALVACEHGKGGGMFNPDGGSGTVCGGFAGTQCPADEWCDFPRDDCGGTDDTGICKPRPIACDDRFDPVCGCDGVVHSNACDGQAVGADINVFGGCPTETGFFGCGARQCEIATEFCRRVGSDIGGEPDSFSCEPLPVGCTSASDCTCLANDACGTQCSGDGATGFTVTCFGG